jgi:anti-anti-sigma factor
MRPFKLTERDLHPGCREIRVEGELDLGVVDELRATLDRSGAEFDQVLISLESCEFIDSTGIAAIVRAHNEMAERGCRVAVYGASSQVLRVLSVTGLTSNGLVFDSAEDALSPDSQTL